MQGMVEGEHEGSTGWRASAHNEVNAPVRSLVQAGSITGNVVIGADPGRGSWSELDEWAEALARAVHDFWHAEEARRQVHDPVALPVRWHAARAALTDHWANIRRRPAEAAAGAEPLALSGRLQQVAEVYGQIPSRRLVVLGPAGAGKTVLAGRLALELLTARRAGEPVPVLVSLAEWNPASTSLHTWLAEQLIRDHPGLDAPAGLGDSSSRAAALVAGERILPILDGFDEIEPGLHEAAVHQLNTIAETPLVLTSREDEYATAVQGADVVTAAAVVTLEELTWHDLAAYLPRTVAGSRTGRWDAVLERMQTQPHDPDSARLNRVLTNPLMVFLARTVYSDTPGQDPTELFDADRFPTEQALRQQLVAQFIPAVYRPAQPGPARSTSGRSHRGWSAEHARGYLTYLAQHLHQAGTRDLVWWQLRDTIPRPRRTLILATMDALISMLSFEIMFGLRSYMLFYSGFVTLLASGLVVTVTAGLTSPRLHKLPRLFTSKAALAFGSALITALTTAFVEWLVGVLVNTLTYGLAGTFTYGFEDAGADGFEFGFLCGTVGGVAAWIVGLRTTGPQPARTRLQIRGRIRILTARFTAGFTLGFTAVFALRFTVDVAGLGGPPPGWQFLGPVIVDEAMAGLPLGLLGGFVAILAAGFETPLNVDEVSSAVESLARDRAHSLRKLLAAVLLIGCLFGLAYGLSEGLPTGLLAGLAAGLAAGWLSLRVTSAWFFWIVLVRGWLPLTGRLPWRTQTFLIDAHRRGVLRQAGASYQFRHATLQDHLTTAASPRTAAAGK